MSVLRVAPGDGCLARRGDALLYLPTAADAGVGVAADGGGGSASAAGVLLAAFERASGDGAGEPFRALAAAVADGGFTAPAFVAVTWGGPVAVLVHGDVSVRTGDADHPELTARGVRTWVERVLDGPGEVSAGAPVAAWSDLEAGVVPAGGFALSATIPAGIGSPIEPLEIADAEATVPPPAEDGALLGPRPPAEPAGPPAATGGESTAMIEARRCPAGHVNPLTAARCRRCGTGLQPGPEAVVRVARPPLGSLRRDDGSELPLDREYVIGRNPGDAPAGGPSPVRIADPKLSRRHLEVRLADWAVHVVDLGSRNGTIVVPRPGAQPLTLTADVAFELEPGATVYLGGAAFTFVAADVPS